MKCHSEGSVAAARPIISNRPNREPVGLAGVRLSPRSAVAL